MIVASADEINLSIYSFKANIKKKKKLCKFASQSRMFL